MLETLPNTAQFLAPRWERRRMAHLQMRARDRSKRLDEHKERRPEQPADVKEALARLTSEGLVAGVSTRSRLLILGGTSQSTDVEIPVFQEGFMISLEPEGTYLALVCGPGNRNQRRHVDTLTDAADFILAIYRERRRASDSLERP